MTPTKGAAVARQQSKVSIIGAGSVGSTCAFSLVTSGVTREIVLIDRNAARAEGECMDLNHGASLVHPVTIRPSDDYKACEGSDIVIVTAGAKQKPGQSRIDLVKTNVEIFKDIIPKIVRYAPDTILLVVTNPMDILTYATLTISQFPAERVIGSGTVLDSLRFKYLLSEHCKVDSRNVHAYIIGEHGDTELPVWSHANIGGMVLSEYCPICDRRCKRAEAFSQIFEQVRDAAYKIIEKKGATYYAIALALVKIVQALLRDENAVMPVSTLIRGYYDVHDVCLSVPCILNAGGVKKTLTLSLSNQEQERFRHSAETLKKIIKEINL